MGKRLFSLKGFAIMALASLSFQAQPAMAQQDAGSANLQNVESILSEDMVNFNHIGRHKAEQLTRMLYRAILFRSPDAGGFHQHVNHIMSGGAYNFFDAAYDMAQGPEFYQGPMRRYSAETIVRNMYQVLLGRNPDSQGMWHWSNAIRSGRAGDAARGIVESPEFRNRHGI